MKARVKWTDGRQFVAESGSGHSVVIDGPPDHGGRNTGPRPMEMLLMGMGSCTAFDILNILDKARAEVTDCVAELDAERADEVPSVFTKIHVHFVVTEFGVAELYGKTLGERAKALIEVAHPDHQEQLEKDFWHSHC